MHLMWGSVMFNIAFLWYGPRTDRDTKKFAWVLAGKIYPVLWISCGTKAYEALPFPTFVCEDVISSGISPSPH